MVRFWTELVFKTYGDGLSCDILLDNNNQRDPTKIHERFVVEGTDGENMEQLLIKVETSVKKLVFEKFFARKP